MVDDGEAGGQHGGERVIELSQQMAGVELGDAGNDHGGSEHPKALPSVVGGDEQAFGLDGRQTPDGEEVKYDAAL